MITAGELKHRITVEYLQQSQDEETGELLETWQKMGTFWGKMMYLSSKEMLQAQAVQSALSARLVLRLTTKTALIDATMRVVHANKIYKIIGTPTPDNKSGKEWITLELSTG